MLFKPYNVIEITYFNILFISPEVSSLYNCRNHTEKELKELSVECKYFGALMKFDTPAKTWEFIGDEFLNINKHPRAISCFKKGPFV